MLLPCFIEKFGQSHLGGNRKYFFHKEQFSVLLFVRSCSRVKLPSGSDETVAAAASTLLSVSSSSSSLVFKGISRQSLPNSASKEQGGRKCFGLEVGKMDG